jgi:hypothetical protein
MLPGLISGRAHSTPPSRSSLRPRRAQQNDQLHPAALMSTQADIQLLSPHLRSHGPLSHDSPLGTGFPTYPPSLLARSTSTSLRSSTLNRSSSTSSSANKQPIALPDPFADDNEFYDPRGLSQRRRGSSAQNSVAGSDPVTNGAERITHSRESSVGGSRSRVMASSLTMSPKSGPAEEWQLVGRDGDGDVSMTEADRRSPSAQLEVSTPYPRVSC